MQPRRRAVSPPPRLPGEEDEEGRQKSIMCVKNQGNKPKKYTMSKINVLIPFICISISAII